jgi:hypothetical protein
VYIEDARLWLGRRRSALAPATRGEGHLPARLPNIEGSEGQA